MIQKRRQQYKWLIYLRPQSRFARLHKAFFSSFAMMKMRGDNVPSTLLHFGVVFSESAEEAEPYIWKYWLRTLFPNDSSDVEYNIFPFPLKHQKILIQTMVHSCLVHNCGTGTASTAFSIAGTNILSFWVYKLAKPAYLSCIITKI